MSKVEFDGREQGVEFHHVQLFVDEIKDVEEYRKLEDQLNALARKGSYDPFSGGMRFLGPKALPGRVAEGKEVWKGIPGVLHKEAEQYSAVKQDIVEQMLVGLGWRVTATYSGVNTRSVLVTSNDARGVKFVVTAPKKQELLASQKNTNQDSEEPYDHFDIKHISRFYASQHGQQGIAVLGFEMPEDGAIENTLKRYQAKHPKMLLGVRRYSDNRSIADDQGTPSKTRNIELGTMTILEAYAYYKDDENGQVDKGTVLRFVHRTGSYASREGWGNPQGVLPGLEDVYAEFDGTSIPAYADHWVSNVTNRKSFLKTLEDVVGFTPKVDFNAGVVAAGRAKIESTVTGNNTARVKATCDSDEILKDQSQIYLPINNALSDVGHVHYFLEQVGQGVQHLASRVKDLVAFIERVNNYRKITGRGLSFLNIPRSYYGHLTAEDLARSALDGDLAKAQQVFHRVASTELCSATGIVKIDITDEEIQAAIEGIDVGANLAKVQAVVRLARYNNLYKLLRDHFDEKMYVKIVENQILVDVQNNDVLFQIFTCNILMREADQEAPFLEFIQRACSQRCLPDGTCAPIKPGCGGFGIRNFLTLFLSIEVSKAMSEVEKARKAGNQELQASSSRRVELFSKQLDESNPILTEIADAMTAEGQALEELQGLADKTCLRVQQLREIAAQQSALKVAGNSKLMELSERYSKLMASV